MKLKYSFLALALFCSMTAYANFHSSPQDEKHFEETNECINCDLSQSYLYDTMHDHANLAGALLVGADLRNSHFERADFTRASLVSVHLDNAFLANADFSDANLSNASLMGASLYRAKISDTQLNSLSDSRCVIFPNGTVNDRTFDCRNYYVSTTERPDAKHFVENNECDDCDLSKARLEKGNHDGAHLSRALLAFTNLHRMQFSYADIQGANMEYADASYTMARNTNFTNADLKKANFEYANLGGSDFTNANVTGVDFSHANLYKAKITNEQLQEAHLYCTVMPDGTMSNNDIC